MVFNLYKEIIPQDNLSNQSYFKAYTTYRKKVEACLVKTTLDLFLDVFRC